MQEPWEYDWSGLADGSNMPRIAPTIPALLAHGRLNHPDRDVFVLDDQTLTYAQLEERSALFARHLLAAGVGKGTRVGVMLPNEESFLISWMGIARIGAVAVTIPSLAKPVEIAKIVAHADLHMLVATRHYLHHDYAERLTEAFPAIAASVPPYRLEQVPYLRAVWFWCKGAGECPAWADPILLDRQPEAGAELLEAVEASVTPGDPAAIIYTSGSTSEPKGVIHSHGNFVRQGLKLATAFDYRPGERAYASLPFFWIGGLTTTAVTLIAIGGTILASGKKGSELLDFIEQQRTNTVVTWPHIIRSLSEDPSFPGRDWSAMRNGLFYEALPSDRKPSDPSLLATPIGMTETNGPYTVIDRFCTEEQRGSLGMLLPGIDARLVDPDSGDAIGEWLHGGDMPDSGGKVGTLHLRMDTMMIGMVRKERHEIFDADGWYDTCDLVSFKQGHLHYHGRADDLIKAHGANVSPREVEAVLMAMPGVGAAHAIGVPDRERGTIVGAVVVAEKGAKPDPQDIRRRAGEQLASYKAPRIVKVLTNAELPMLPSSKVDRRKLASMLEEAWNSV